MTDHLDPELLARALAYTDAVGLSDGTDRPASTVAELDLDSEPCQDCHAPIEWDEPAQTYRHHGPACYLATSSGWILVP
jgi:hypothetical protein